MSLSYLAAEDRTVPAFPLGQPYDGTERYGMTADQAALYRWLIQHRSNDRAFIIDVRDIKRSTGHHLSRLHELAEDLVERGWLRRLGKRFAFVQPIMHFKVR